MPKIRIIGPIYPGHILIIHFLGMNLHIGRLTIFHTKPTQTKATRIFYRLFFAKVHFFGL